MIILKELIIRSPRKWQGEVYILEQDFSVELSDDHVYTAPAGMVFDGASIPRFFWRVIGNPFGGRYRHAAAIHDALYKQQALIDHIPVSIAFISKKDADNIFLEMMKADGVNWLKRKTMYDAVKWFGGSSWQGPKSAPRIW